MVRATILTREAARLLESFDDGYETILPLLSVRALLTPSESKKAVEELRSKGYVKYDSPFVSLTRLGDGLRSTKNYDIVSSLSSRYMASDSLEDELENQISKL